MEEHREYCTQIVPGESGEVNLYLRPGENPRLTLVERTPIIVIDDRRQPLFTIRRERRFPLPRYAMYRDDTLVWMLSTTSVLRNRHMLETAGGERWKFRTPFFSVSFSGKANDGAEVVGQIGGRTHEWYFRVPTGKDSVQFLSALAFMHRHWYFHG